MYSIKDAVQPCVSIILPCYNVEKYLREALDSALNQTLANIEIIPVDDGSPDNCADIIKEYAEKDVRIRPIFKENGGYGTAVNAGIEIATGEYIAILEPDDYVMEDYYYILYHEAKKYDLDVCGVNSYCEVRDYEPPKLIQTHWTEHSDYLSFEDINDYFANSGAGITLKIYKSVFLNENQITLNEEIRAYHDVPFIAKVLDKALRVRIIKGTGYFYRKDNLTSTTKNKISFYNIINAINYIVFYAEDKLSSRKASLLGYSLKHLIFYYKRSIEVGNKSNAEYIFSLIKKILNYNKIRINHTNKSFILQQFPEKVDIFEFSAFNVISFNECKVLNLEYVSSVYELSETISEQAFFSYYAITTQNIEHIEKIKNNICVLLSNFIGLKNIFISDFIEMYLNSGMFNFNRDWNQTWYLAFMNYMQKYDSKYQARLFESLSHMNSTESLIQYMPSISGQFDNTFSGLTDNLRKTKVINNFSSKYMKKLLEFIQDKSIAVVGNAPSGVGLHNGMEIDSHDIVIRFNNFSTSEEHIQDYGTKTNIWAITPSIETLFFQDDFYNFDFVISPDINLSIPKERIRILYNYIILGGSFYNLKSIDCRRAFNMNTPSIGLYVLFYLFENINCLGKVSLYGFSPLLSKNDYRHYFNDDPIETKDLKFHDWDKEAVVVKELKKIFEKHNTEVK